MFTSITAHTHPVVFGRKVTGCPRCAELAAGAAPVKWHGRGSRYDTSSSERRADIQAHYASAKHRTGGCGPVCTYGDY